MVNRRRPATQGLCIHNWPISFTNAADYWAKSPCVYTLDCGHPYRATTEGGRMRASDRAYAALRDEIIEWRLPPGTVLGEVEQSARLGVSRTPLREALRRLSADGLVAAAGGRGVVVTDVALDDIRELFELRRALEEQAARLAAERGDRRDLRRSSRRELLAGADLLDGRRSGPPRLLRAVAASTRPSTPPSPTPTSSGPAQPPHPPRARPPPRRRRPRPARAPPPPSTSDRRGDRRRRRRARRARHPRAPAPQPFATSTATLRRHLTSSREHHGSSEPPRPRPPQRREPARARTSSPGRSPRSPPTRSRSTARSPT